MTNELRYFIDLLESEASQPSTALIEAVKCWLDGWNIDNREKVQAALLALRSESMKFLAPSYPPLYRGMSITEEHARALRKKETILVEMPRLASWTTEKRIALDYAEGAALPGILITKTNLKPILDIGRFLSFFPDEFDEDGFEPDYIRYAQREGEVICEHDGPMTIRPREGKIY